MRTFAMASILLTTLVLGTDAASAAPWCTEYGGSGRGGSNCGFYCFEQCMANAWATAASAGATRLRTPTGPAARHTGAIAAAIRVGQVSEAADQFFLLLITFDCSIAANPNRN